MEDWDLQSIVRGCFSKDFSTSTTMDNTTQQSFSPLFSVQQAYDHDDDLLFTSTTTLPDMFETNAIFDELEQLYKPFYPIFNPISVSDDQTEKVEEKHEPLLASSSIVPSVSSTSAHVAKYKRRKTLHKRVVLQVRAEDISSDLWAWRKYGQKPIKGSPYPRSYYRCSSLKGCLARKQVEQSCSDPGMFIITYTAEHNHSQPTRRNSLAGTTRHRFSSTSKNPTTHDHSDDMPKPKISNSSPISTPLSTTTEDHEFSQEVIKKESTEEDETIMAEDMIFNNDFFVGLDGLDGFGYV